MKKTIYLVKSLVFGLFVIGCFAACSSEDDPYVPVDGEEVRDLYEVYSAYFTFINGGKELELTYLNRNENTIPSVVEYKGKEYRVTKIGDGACNGSNNIEEIPEGIVCIGYGAFGGNQTSKIQLPSTLRYIGAFAFIGNENLQSIDIPEGVTVIENGTFFRDRSLRTVTIPNSVTEIKDSAFCSTGIIELTIPNSVKTIGANSFRNCTNLKKVTLGEGLKSISKDAFYYTPKLEEVISMIKEPFPAPGAFENRGGTLYVPKGTIDLYKNTEGWNFSRIVEHSF